MKKLLDWLRLLFAIGKPNSILVNSWFAARLKCAREGHLDDAGTLVNMGMQKVFTCTRCGRRLLY